MQQRTPQFRRRISIVAARYDMNSQPSSQPNNGGCGGGGGGDNNMKMRGKNDAPRALR